VVAGGDKLGIYQLLRFLKRVKTQLQGKRNIPIINMSSDGTVGIVTGYRLND
jgi:hypothetical protein